MYMYQLLLPLVCNLSLAVLGRVEASLTVSTELDLTLILLVSLVITLKALVPLLSGLLCCWWLNHRYLLCICCCCCLSSPFWSPGSSVSIFAGLLVVGLHISVSLLSRAIRGVPSMYWRLFLSLN